MTDTIVKGSGNSRSIRSVPNLAQLAPTYDNLLELLTTSGLPIDLGPLNSAGLDVRGTDLNKANVLPNATCTSLGISTSSVPKDAFNRLRTLISSAQDDADAALDAIASSAFMETGSYTGTSEAKTLSFGINWKVCLIGFASENYGVGYSAQAFLLFKDGNTGIALIGNVSSFAFSSTNKSLTLPSSTGNIKNNKYQYIVFGN